MNLFSPPKKVGRALRSAPRLAQPLFLSLLLATTVVGARAGGIVTNCSEVSLRAALSGGGDVVFAANCTNLTLTQPLFITNNTVMDAGSNSVTLSGGGNVPLLRVTAGNVALAGLRLVNGKALHSGAALMVEPGSTVTVSNCTFVGNRVVAANGQAGAPGSNSSGGRAGDGGDGTLGFNASGGAIWNAGDLLLVACTLSNNAATAGDGGGGGRGGSATGTLGVGGTGGNGGSGGAAYGGAVFNRADGNLTLIDCLVSSNTAAGGDGGAGGAGGTAPFPGYDGSGGLPHGGLGGGLYNAGSLTVMSSSFAHNTTKGGNSTAGGTEDSGMGIAGHDGAAAEGGGLCNIFSTEIINSTFFGNTATGGNGGNGGRGTGTLSRAGRGGDGGHGVGGGIRNLGQMDVVNCTLSGCAAQGGTNGVSGIGPYLNDNGDLGEARGGNIASSSGVCRLYNSLIVWEQFGGCGYGSFEDRGYNMTSDTSISLGESSFPNRPNPRLGAFGMHGGLTPTRPLLPESTAIDRIPHDEITPDLDQRGVPRNDEFADIGAYEVGTFPVTVSVLEGTNALPEVEFTADSEPAETTYTDGNYSLFLTPGSHVLTPSLTNYVFVPQSLNLYVNSATNASFQAFSALTPDSVQINPTTNGQVQLTGGAITGLAYRVETSTNLINWSAVATNVAPVKFTERVSTNVPAKFFRLRR